MPEVYVHSAVGLFSAAILTAIGFCVITNSHSGNSMNRRFLIIVNLTLVSTLVEAASWLYDGRKELVVFLDIVTFTSFLLANVITWFLLRYLFVILGEKTKINSFWNAVITVPALASVLLLIIDRFTNMYYIIDENGFYVEGDWYMLCAFFPVASMLMGTAVLIRYRRYLGKDALVLVTAYSVLPISLVILQSLPDKISYALLVFSSDSVTFTLFILLLYGGIQSQIGKRLSEELTAVAVEKERITTELNIATDIQASMLPRVFPPFPERGELDLFASMKPAKEVGGDFYDFFMTGDKLWCIMADVSGKGVPAALFMVIGKTLIKTTAQSGKSPGEVLESVNNLLCEGNDAGLFITAFAGCLDLNTGGFTCSNAGHNLPLMSRNGRWDICKMQSEPDLPLALYDGMPYGEESFVLEKGDGLFMYTDGVTEAFNADGGMYGDDRLVKAANNANAQRSDAFVGAIRKDLEAFVDGAEQSDDITLLALIYNGRPESEGGME